ncbi:MAG: beta-ketoacyl synthase N-terminal-like domain-containing protein [Chloroflexi bacterium]|nr:beta-ketoacyl synthase N-terminal-like domain-containing protein [Chloroflexota bacterium]
MRRVGITGMGVVTAAGQGLDAFTLALQTGQSGIKQRPAASDLPLAFGGLLADFELSAELMKLSDQADGLGQKAQTVARRAPLSVQASVLSAVEAWRRAQLATRTIDSTKISLVVAGQNLNQGYHYAIQQKYQATPEYLPPRYGLHFLDTDQVGVLSALLGIHGEGQTVGGASASGNVGLMHGYRLVQWGLAEICVVVGALQDLSPLEIHAFAALGALGGKTIREADRACRPFDRQREGFIYGQGSGCLILESEASAKRRGVDPLAELVGCALVLDGNHLIDPNAAGEAQAMRQALQMANLAPADVDYLNAHGTASVLGDVTEITAIKEVFGEAVTQLWLNSTKSLTGHCLTAAGTIEAIATILQMKGGFVHPNLNLEQPIDDACRFVGQQSQSATINIAMSNSFGFGGINSSIVLKQWDAGRSQEASDG